MNLIGIIVIFAVAALAFFALRKGGGGCCGGHHGRGHSGKDTSGSPDAGDTERDPVCGMQVRITPETPVAEHQGHIYHFCSHGCRERFLADPAAFSGGSAGTSAGHAGHGCCG